MEIDSQFILLLVAVYCAYKIGYWSGYREGMDWALGELENSARILKKIGEKLHADTRREI